jgi:NMD protein affecting ribosome stability and mRNA decay
VNLLIENSDKMVWTKSTAKLSGKCKNCGKQVNKGDIVVVEIKGIFPRPKALCEDCFNQLHPNEKTVSEAGLALRRFTMRTS